MNRTEAINNLRKLLKNIQEFNADPCDDAMEIVTEIVENSEQYEVAIDVAINEIFRMQGLDK